ncbi:MULTISPECIES: ricin-type beta-trefoil lectin domain protein [Streptomyces]
MKRTVVGRFVAIAAAAASIGIATASPAAANGPVNWENKVTNSCLDAYDDNSVGLGGCTSKRWYDEIHPEHSNNWIQYFTPSGYKKCLDSSNSGSVYLNPCTPASRYNKYQFWSEEQWNGGWVLKNVATGRCLSATSSGSVRTLPCDAGNKYQFWK